MRQLTAEERAREEAREAAEAARGGLAFPRWALWLVVPGAVGPLVILGFILWSESAHDVERCPYSERKRVELATGVTVVEDARRCLEEVEEHRFTLHRGSESRLLGRRRFAPDAFAAGRYRWHAEISKEGEVQLHVENDGHPPMLFREGTAEEHAEGSSK